MEKDNFLKNLEKNVPTEFTKEWTEQFYEKEDPWGVKRHKWQRIRAQRSLNLLGQRELNSGIDLCCGEGILTTEHLTRHCRNVIGIDYSANAIGRAKKGSENIPNVIFMQDNVMTIDFNRLETLPDFIFCSDAFFYFNRFQQRQLLDKIAALKTKPLFLLVCRLLFKQYCTEHPDLVGYNSDFDFFDNWYEFECMVKDKYNILKIEPVLAYPPEHTPWGDNRYSSSLRNYFISFF